MNTREIATEYRLSHWSQVIQNRVESGLSIKAYCSKTAICENTYYYWQRKLREAACEELAAMQHGGSSQPHSGFTEVLLSEYPPLPPSGAAGQSQISIESVGVRLTASNEYPVEKLAVLLREMRRPC